MSDRIAAVGQEVVKDIVREVERGAHQENAILGDRRTAGNDTGHQRVIEATAAERGQAIMRGDMTAIENLGSTHEFTRHVPGIIIVTEKSSMLIPELIQVKHHTDHDVLAKQ